ncbi:hypothetical protein KY362_06500 [Candidatus Woesearchaeota archaeon]|nr:hypothetical protein [Candidatus Woesearchaeota archaeon]
MGEARHNILVKAAQMQKMNHHFQGDQLLDTVNLLHFSEALSHESYRLMKM